jgi:hypothetical protein
MVRNNGSGQTNQYFTLIARDAYCPPRIIEFRDPDFVALPRPPRRSTFGIQGSNDSQQNERGKAYRSDSGARRHDKQMRQKTWGACRFDPLVPQPGPSGPGQGCTLKMHNFAAHAYMGRVGAFHHAFPMF